MQDGLVEELIKTLAANKENQLFSLGYRHLCKCSDLAVATLILNDVAGNIGKSVILGRNNTPNLASAKDILDVLNSGLNTVFIDNIDLVYAFSADAKVAEALGKIKNVVFFGTESNDTVSQNTLFISGTSLEKWGDPNAKLGLYSLLATMRSVNGNEIMSAEDIILYQPRGLKAPLASLL